MVGQHVADRRIGGKLLEIHVMFYKWGARIINSSGSIRVKAVVSINTLKVSLNIKSINKNVLSS